jgi:cyclopropane-fatty-acyl-phospholipid synthase
MQQNKHVSGAPLGVVARSFRRLVDQRLASLRGGRLTIADRDGFRSFGDAGHSLEATITVVNPRFYRRIAIGGGLGAAESLMDGEWHCSDLTALVRIFTRNMAVSDRLNRGLARVTQLAARFFHWRRRNTIAGSKRNIRAHYDLGNEFYALFLDPTMTYSCGIFESPGATMRQASLAKIDRACRKLDLQPGDHLLEIGTGWGTLAIHAAKHFGCRVTTTTISDQQFVYAEEAIRQNGLEDQITLLRDDYRALTGKFDKLVSIEMIEAVGPEFYETFFRKCRELLKPEGMALVQSIVIADERYEEHLRSVDFIRRYIFPGGGLPSVSALTKAAAAGGGFRVMQLEDIGRHYAETLRRWQERFHARLDDARALGFDERFIRMWDYYLRYCEAAFEERQVNNVQMLFGGRECHFDPISRCRIDANADLQTVVSANQTFGFDTCWQRATRVTEEVTPWRGG